MYNVIKLSKAGIAAIVFAIALTGCGGESSSNTNTQSTGGSGSGDSVSSQDAGSSSGSGTDTGSGGGGSETEQPVDRTASLTWNAPLQRQNDESLKMAELAGYVINYGQDPDNLDQTLRVNDAYVMEYTVEDLSDGTWYFNIQAEDDNGLMSPPSDTVSKTVQS